MSARDEALRWKPRERVTMEIQGRRRSSNFEDRGAGSAGHAAGGLPIGLLLSIAQRLGFKGTLIVGALLGAVYLFMPDSVRQLLLGPSAGSSASAGQGSACQLSADNQGACDFSRVILASTEDVWKTQFETQKLPSYGTDPGPYREPTLVVFSGGVQTGGCGCATSDVGPFYCPADKKLYIDPNFYGVMEKRLKAPGDFAQAYVIAHEVGHHVQNLIGTSRLKVPGESNNQSSVRVELQADCLAGVWGHSARSSLEINEEDLREALTAAHAIGDDALGHRDTDDYTHGSSDQRVRWFRRGFDGGDARA